MAITTTAHDRSAGPGLPAMEARRRIAPVGAGSPRLMPVANAPWAGPPTRILIADDHHVALVGLRLILQTQPGWQVVAVAADGKDVVRKALEVEPDVAVLDQSLPPTNGIEAARQIRKHAPRIQVLILATHESESMVSDALDAGACGYLLKSDSSEYLISAIRTLSTRKPSHSGSPAGDWVRTGLVTPERA